MRIIKNRIEILSLPSCALLVLTPNSEGNSLRDESF